MTLFKFKRGAFLRDARGSTAVEYGLIAALIAMALVASLTQVGTTVNKPLDCANGVIKGQTKDVACK